MEITETTALIRIGVSLVLGLSIGIERERHKHQAGVRTFTLVCIGSTLAMLVSIYICQQNLNLLNGDPGRIAAQVLTGVGFIGAGLIMQNKDGISGLTTAATVFTTAIIGLAAGAGMLLVATVFTVIVLAVLMLSAVKKYEKNRQTTKLSGRKEDLQKEEEPICEEGWRDDD